MHIVLFIRIMSFNDKVCVCVCIGCESHVNEKLFNAYKNSIQMMWWYISMHLLQYTFAQLYLIFYCTNFGWQFYIDNFCYYFSCFVLKCGVSLRYQLKFI